MSRHVERCILKAERQEERRRQIELAAYEVLAESGYKAASMLAIAKRAGASNETLYRWYGNKQTLFQSLIEGNAKEVSELLRSSFEADEDALETLARVGPLLLRLLVSERAITINRAAVADAMESGVLGQTLSRSGRESVMPLIADIFDKAGQTEQLSIRSAQEAAEIYLSLLVGDLQIRRAIGVVPDLKKGEIQRRAEKALERTCRLFEA